MPGPIIQKTSDSIWKFRSNSAIIGLRFYTHAKFSKVPIWDFGTLRMVLIQTVVFLGFRKVADIPQFYKDYE